MLAAFSVTPLGDGESVGEQVAEAAPRVTVIIKLDWRPGQSAGRLGRDVESVERRLR